MKNKLIRFGFVIMVTSACPCASAYELGTHARLTYKAYLASQLVQDQALIDSLGLDTLIAENSKDPFGGFYYDAAGSSILSRKADPYEKKFMTEKDIKEVPKPVIPPDVTHLSLPGWLMRGTIREDDAYGEKNPQDDPYTSNSTLRRPLHHFFDPVNNAPLNMPTSYLQQKLESIDNDIHTAPAWAQGTTNDNAFTSPNTPETTRRNHFTVFDAREAMYRALTGRKQDGTNADPNENDTNPASETVRKTYWATTFRALGDIMHLNQDMAQPQHTRNDPHSGKIPLLGDFDPTGHASIYEHYMEARATQDKTYYIDGAKRDIQGLTYEGYSVPHFAKYSDYWSTPNETFNVREGLADYSNRTFFSYGTNLGHNIYASPSNDPGAYDSEDGIGLLDPPWQFHRSIHLVKVVSPTESIVMTTQSVFDFWLFQTKKTYSLDRFAYDAMASKLIPRAVAYSAGLIDYFFRGKMEITLPDEGVYSVVDHAVENQKDLGGFKIIKLKLRNITPDPTGQPGIERMQTGTVEAVVKFHRNNCYMPDLSGEYGTPTGDWQSCRSQEEEIVVSDPQPAPDSINDGATTLTFNFQNPVPINATDVFLQVVYRGILGEENDAVVVATKDISEPTFDVGFYNRIDQYLYGYNGGTLTFKEFYCDSQNPPMDYETCKTYYSYSGYFRFVAPSNYDPGNPVSSFDPLVALEHVPVGQYGRIAVLAEPGELDAYWLTIFDHNQGVNTGMTVYNAAKNQLDITTNSMPDSEQYNFVRGIYAAPVTYLQLSDHSPDLTDIPDLSPLEPQPGTINFLPN
jgi:hypothetical protein